MASRVVLHIGLMKSGTTFIQQRLTANRDLLAAQGVLYPGPNWSRQVRAVNDLAGFPGQFPGAWADLVAEVQAHPGPVLISMEFLVGLRPEAIARAHRDLRGPTGDTPVSIIATVRDLGRVVPSMWQEAAQNGRFVPWPDYLDGIRNRVGSGPKFWRRQNAGHIVAKWVAEVGPDRATIITVPPPGSDPELLWRRFTSVADISTPDGTPWRPGLRTNESIGVVSTVLMIQLNERLAELDKETYVRQVKPLGKFVLPDRAGDEKRIGLKVPSWLRKEAGRVVTELRATGAHVEGDLAELKPQNVPGVDPGSVSSRDLLEAAVDVLARVLESPPAERAKSARERRDEMLAAGDA